MYASRTTNLAWKNLLTDFTIRIDRNMVQAGNKKWTGYPLGGHFTWPIQNSAVAPVPVAVISGSGLKGMKATEANQYFAGGSGFPDFMIFRLNMLVSGSGAIEMAGFFDNEWKLDKNEFKQQ